MAPSYRFQDNPSTFHSPRHDQLEIPERLSPWRSPIRRPWEFFVEPPGKFSPWMPWDFSNPLERTTAKFRTWKLQTEAIFRWSIPWNFGGLWFTPFQLICYIRGFDEKLRLMEEILYRLIWRLSLCAKGFIDNRWCRISATELMLHPNPNHGCWSPGYLD